MLILIVTDALFFVMTLNFRVLAFHNIDCVEFLFSSVCRSLLQMFPIRDCSRDCWVAWYVRFALIFLTGVRISLCHSYYLAQRFPNRGLWATCSQQLSGSGPWSLNMWIDVSYLTNVLTFKWINNNYQFRGECQ